MGTKYSSVSVSGYNSSPPADDGSVTASNQVKWSTIKTKLPDPLKTAIESINSAIVSFVDQGPSDKTAAYTTTATDHLKVITVTSGVTISLGDAASMAAGYIVTVKNRTSGTVTVAPVTSADTLNGTAGSSVVLGAQMAETFVCTGSGYYTLSNAISSLTATETLTNKTLTSPTINTPTISTPVINGTITGTGVATQADMEAAVATNLIVSPVRQANHPLHPKAWCYFDGATAAIQAASNVNSITRNAAGTYTVNLGITMSSASYCVQATAHRTASNNCLAQLSETSPLTTTTFVIKVLGINTSTLIDTQVHVVVWGDL